MTQHEWYWGNGRPCCVNCGALARCEDQYERNGYDTELRAERDAAVVRAERAEAERDFMLDRSQFLHPDVGLSSISLVRSAMVGCEPYYWPVDMADLGRCVRTYEAAPEHLRPAMRPWLERFCDEVSRRYPEAADLRPKEAE